VSRAVAGAARLATLIMSGILTTLGIVRCRDLDELYFGGRFVVTIKNTQFLDLSAITRILSQNPSRIRYEIFIADAVGAAGSQLVLGTSDEVRNNQGIFIQVANLVTMQIVRDFTTDAEGVVPELWCQFLSGAFSVSVRETILTPLPADESP
jgi:hypothetical protein